MDWKHFLKNLPFNCLSERYLLSGNTCNSREQVKLNAALLDQAALLDLTHDAIVVRELDGTLHYWNQGAQEMYGYTNEDIKGRHLHEFLKTEFPKPKEQIDQDVLSTGRWDGELIQYTKDGRRIIVDSRQVLKTDAENKPFKLLEINTDITERRQAEQRQLALVELERSKAELERFAYFASHDLQEPLRGIAGCLQILEKNYKDNLDDNAKELIQYSIDAAGRLRQIVSDLLSLSQGRHDDVAFEALDLSQLLDQAKKNLAAAIKESEAIITNDPLPILPVYRALIIQLFQNLIGNAIKFRSSDSPKIHIGAQYVEGQWLLSVQDNGIGFEQKYADRIFKAFERLNSRSSYPGTGIGLAICKQTVEQHGGTIWAKSESGKGATFYFTLLGQQTHQKVQSKQ
jgi:PAS domain S-box-containing protein